jgi:MFS family permease
MLFNIPAPPLPLLSDVVVACTAAVCLFVGAAILLWGWVLSRWFLGAAGMAVGLLIAMPLSDRLGGVDPNLARIGAAALLGLLALLLARPVWALLAAALLGLVAEGVVLARVMNDIPADQQPAFQAADTTFAAWALALGEFAMRGLQTLWIHKMPLVLIGIVPAALLALVLALLRARLARILMTSLLGALAMVAGPLLAGAHLRPALWDRAWGLWYVLAAVGGLLMIIGLAFQCRLAMEADKKEKERLAKEAEKDKEKEKQPEKTKKK